MQKLAVLSDIHGNIAALEAVVADFTSRQVDGVVNLGDHVSGPLWPQETIAYLMRQDWLHILGNHDRQLYEQEPQQHGLSDRYALQKIDQTSLAWLKSLPARVTMPDDMLCCHGAPGQDAVYLLETVAYGRARLASQTEIKNRLGDLCCRVLLCGHSHIPRVVELQAELLIVNPGSVGLPAYDDELPEYHVMETGSPHARYAIMEKVGERWRVEQIAIAYDFQSAARQARHNGRRDWEIGLASGYMQDT